MGVVQNWLSKIMEERTDNMGFFTDGFKLLKKASEPLYKYPKSIKETIEIIVQYEKREKGIDETD